MVAAIFRECGGPGLRKVPNALHCKSTSDMIMHSPTHMFSWAISKPPSPRTLLLLLLLLHLLCPTVCGTARLDPCGNRWVSCPIASAPPRECQDSSKDDHQNKNRTEQNSLNSLDKETESQTTPDSNCRVTHRPAACLCRALRYSWCPPHCTTTMQYYARIASRTMAPFQNVSTLTPNFNICTLRHCQRGSRTPCPGRLLEGGSQPHVACGS